MAAFTSSRNKRNAEFQFSSPSAFGYAYGHPHTSKKLKPSFCYSNLIDTKESSVSRALSRYPPPVTPIFRQPHGPCIVAKGFIANSNRLDSSSSGYIRQQPGSFVGRMGNFLRANYEGWKEALFGSRRSVKFEKEDVIDVDHSQTVDDENAGSGDSDVEEVAMVETEREDIDKSGELQGIIAKYIELDEDDAENPAFQPSTSSGVVSQSTDGNTLESLSLNQKPDDSDVDASLTVVKTLESLSLNQRPNYSDVAAIPYHKKLLEDSARKHDSNLRRLNLDIKLHEQKRASFKQLHPVKKEEDTLIEPFRPLTDDEEEIVANAFSNSSRRKVLVNHENSNITITGEILRCLEPGQWLNDEVINLYLELLKERESKEPKKFLKCHFFNTFFYKKLTGGNTGYDYKSVRRWTTQRKLGYSLLECDKIFIPVHKSIHWCLAIINKKEEKFQYLDSLGGIDKQVMRVLAKYIVDEVKDKNGEDIDVTSWKQEYVKDLPKQKNGHDCGVFMIKYADFYSRNIGLCFNQEHMPYFRLRTANEILELRAD